MVANFVSNINSMISGDFFVAFIILCSIFFTVILLFPQFRFIKESIRIISQRNCEDVGISHIKSFLTALGSRIGVGNIVGVASAISIGGPGSIFWMWIFGIFLSGLAVAESISSQIYKIKDGNEYLGGPCYFIKHLFNGNKFASILASIYAVVGVIGNGFLLSGIQTNTVANSVMYGFNVDINTTIIIIGAITSIIIWGGIKRISVIESYITIVKLFGFLVLGLIVIIWNWNNLLNVLLTIITSAWGFSPIFGAMIGHSISIGIRRSVFMTDVGFGSGGIFSAAAKSKNPMEQALLQAFSVLITIFITCSLSALIILVSDSYQVLDADQIIYTGINFPGSEAGIIWVQAAFNSVPFLCNWSPKIISILTILFAAGSIVGNYYLAESNLKYLFKKNNKKIITLLKITYVFALIVFSTISTSLIWDLADIGLGALCWINLICMLFISPKIINIVKEYTNNYKNKTIVTFDPEKYGFKDKTGSWN